MGGFHLKMVSAPAALPAKWSDDAMAHVWFSTEVDADRPNAR